MRFRSPNFTSFHSLAWLRVGMSFKFPKFILYLPQTHFIYFPGSAPSSGIRTPSRRSSTESGSGSGSGNSSPRFVPNYIKNPPFPYTQKTQSFDGAIPQVSPGSLKGLGSFGPPKHHHPIPYSYSAWEGSISASVIPGIRLFLVFLFVPFMIISLIRSSTKPWH